MHPKFKYPQLSFSNYYSNLSKKKCMFLPSISSIKPAIPKVKPIFPSSIRLNLVNKNIIYFNLLIIIS